MIRIGLQPFLGGIDTELEEIIILVRAGTITEFRAIEDLKKLFQETIEQAMPEKWKNVMGIGYRLGYNAALEEYRENLLKAIGKAGE